MKLLMIGIDYHTASVEEREPLHLQIRGPSDS